jgi:hypothetical protein
VRFPVPRVFSQHPGTGAGVDDSSQHGGQNSVALSIGEQVADSHMVLSERARRGASAAATSKPRNDQSRDARRQQQLESHMKQMASTFAGGARVTAVAGPKGLAGEQRIKDNLVLTALDIMKAELDERLSVPKALEQNKYIWAKAMLKNKSLQDLIADFTTRVSGAIKREININQDKIDRFMKQTRAPEASLGSAKQFLD